MQKTSVRMAISGLLGFAFFLIANFSMVFADLHVIAGLIQIAINVFVFVVWLHGYRTSVGFKKFVAAIGVAMPVIMTSITLVRVLLPFFFR